MTKFQIFFHQNLIIKLYRALSLTSVEVRCNASNIKRTKTGKRFEKKIFIFFLIVIVSQLSKIQKNYPKFVFFYYSKISMQVETILMQPNKISWNFCGHWQFEQQVSFFYLINYIILFDNQFLSYYCQPPIIIIFFFSYAAFTSCFL